MMTERPDETDLALLPIVLEDKMQILVPLHLGAQILLITISYPDDACVHSNLAGTRIDLFLCGRNFDFSSVSPADSAVIHPE